MDFDAPVLPCLQSFGMRLLSVLVIRLATADPLHLLQSTPMTADGAIEAKLLVVTRVFSGDLYAPWLHGKHYPPCAYFPCAAGGALETLSRSLHPQSTPFDKVDLYVVRINSMIVLRDRPSNVQRSVQAPCVLPGSIRRRCYSYRALPNLSIK